MAVEAGGELAPVDEQRDAGVRAQDRKRQRQRRVRHVAAADVEEPGDRFRARQHRRRGAVIGERAAQPGALRRRALAGKAVGVRYHRRERRRRPPRPDPVDRVGDRLEAGPGALGAGFEALDLLRRVQPRVIADHHALPERPGEPARRRLVDQVTDLIEPGIGLRRRLQRVAAVDKEGGALGQYDRQPGRAGEAGQPGETLAASRHVFALMLVGARHDEAVERARCQLFAQQCEPRGARQPSEILGRQPVAEILGEPGPHRFERVGQRRRGRLGDQRMPGGADLGRRCQDAGNQGGDAVGIERRPGFLKQMRQLVPIGLCASCRHRPFSVHHLLILARRSALGEPCCIAVIMAAICHAS